MTMSAADFLDQWFETEPLKATMSASGIIGTFQGPRSPGTAYVLLHHYMGEIDGAFRAWGIPKGGTGGVSNAIASAARSLGVEIRTEAPVARIATSGGRATGVIAGVRRGDRGRLRAELARLEPHVPEAARGGHARPGVRGRGPPLQVPRLQREGEPRARRAAGARVQARRGGVAARRDQLQPVARLHGAGLRRREVRAAEPPAVHRHDHPDARRPEHGAARQAHHQLLRAVRAVPPRRRRGLGRRRRASGSART